MHYLTKVFKVPMGHRLSKLEESRCKFIHGHNFTIEVTIKSKVLNEDNMIMDFSELKEIVNKIIDTWDHGMFLNENDKSLDNSYCRLHYTEGDPTAEYLTKFLYYELRSVLPENIFIHSVSMWETDSSKATYSEV